MFKKWKELFKGLFDEKSETGFYIFKDALVTLLMFPVYFISVLFYPLILAVSAPFKGIKEEAWVE